MGSEVVIIDLNSESLSRLALTGPWCLRCPLCEHQERQGFSAECLTSPADIEPIVRDSRSGVKLAIRQSNVVGYAIFGQPALFPGIARAKLAVDPDSLFLAALSTTASASEQNVHADLLIEVMNFARDHGYTRVVAAFRTDDPMSAEPSPELLAAGGFTLGETGYAGIGLASITMEEWDNLSD